MMKLHGQSKQKYSVRKYAVGTASVMIGCLLMAPAVLADEQGQSSEWVDANVSLAASTPNSHTVSVSDTATSATTASADATAASTRTTPASTTTDVTPKTDAATTADVTPKTDVATTTPASADTSAKATATTTTPATANTPVVETASEATQTEEVPETTATTEAEVPEADTTVATQTPAIPDNGRYTFETRTEVKNQADMDSPTVFYMEKGSSVNYDKVVNADDHRWISYRSYSGVRRYAPIAELTASTPVAPKTKTDKIDTTTSSTQTLPSSGSYTFDKQVEVKNQAKVDSPTQFTLAKGDRVNYDKVLTTDGYQWLSYKSYSGTRRYVALNKLSPSSTKSSETPTTPVVKGDITIANQTSQGFDVVVKNVKDSQGVKEIKVPVWSENDGQDDLIWYTAKADTDNTYKVNVDIKDHKNNTGVYNVHLYYVENNGQLRGVAGTQVTVKEASKPSTTETTTTKAQDLPSSGSYTFDKQVEVKNQAKVDSPTQFTLAKGDRVNYDKVLTTDGYQWLSYKSYSGTRRYVALNKLSPSSTKSSETPTTPVVKGDITIANQTSQGFDVVVKNVKDSQGVKEIKVPVWSENDGQDDLIWYTAKADTDNTYKVNVDIKDHKNNTGVYNVHLYYVDNNGQLRGVAGTQVTVKEAKAQAEQTETSLPASGSYTFTARTSIKSEAKMDAPTIAYYDKGDSVNYDKVVKADGYQWLSYMSYSGNRRYLPVEALTSTKTTDSKATTDTSKKDSTKTDVKPATNDVATAKSTLPASGSYTFDKEVEVKASASVTAPTQFTFTAGETINYDKSLVADNHQWISYTNYKGVRRYVDLGQVRASATTTKLVADTSLPSSGSYIFTTRTAITNEASNSAPVFAYYNAGSSVNYDKIVKADGANWLSYISGSGVRRYIKVN